MRPKTCMQTPQDRLRNLDVSKSVSTSSRLISQEQDLILKLAQLELAGARETSIKKSFAITYCALSALTNSIE